MPKTSRSPVAFDLRKSADLFAMLGDANRLGIVRLLMQNGPTNVTAISQAINQSQPATSHHLKYLMLSGVLECTRNGKSNYYRVADLAGLRGTVASVFAVPVKVVAG